MKNQKDLVFSFPKRK